MALIGIQPADRFALAPKADDRNVLEAVVEKHVEMSPDERLPILYQSDLNGVNGGFGDEGGPRIDFDALRTRSAGCKEQLQEE